MSVSGSTEVVARRRGEAELGVNEIFDDRAVVVADRAVRLVASDQWKIHRREVREKTVVRREALDSSDHDLRLLPVRAFLFVDDGRNAVRREIGGEVLLGLPLQFQPDDEEKMRYAFSVRR